MAKFQEVERVGGEAMDAGIDEMDDRIVPKGNYRGGVDDALVHFAIEPVADGIDRFLKRLFVELVETGIIITGIVRRRRVLRIEVAEIILRIGVVGDPTAAEE